MQIGPLINEVLVRVRDPQGSAHPRDFVRLLADRLQVAIVRAMGCLIRERDFPLAAEQIIYSIDPNEVIRVVDLYDSEGVRLAPQRWQQFALTRRDWWRAIDTLLPNESWAPFSPRFLLVWPADDGANTLTLRYQKRPAELTADDVELELPSEYHMQLRDFLEILLLLRQRDAALKDALGRVAQ